MRNSSDRAGLCLLAVTGILFAATMSWADECPRQLLVLGQGPDGHPPTTHEFMAGARIIEHLATQNPSIRITVSQADEPWPEGVELLDKADGIVLFLSQGALWMRQNPERLAALERLRERQGGIVALHWAVGAKDPRYIETCLDFLGGCHGGDDRKYVKMDGRIEPADTMHPIATAIGPIEIHEEFYYRLKFARGAAPIQPVMTVRIDGNNEVCAWAWPRPDGGRSFGFVGLHFHKNWEREEYRRLVMQAIHWTLKLPIPQSGLDVPCPESVLRLQPTGS